MSVLDDFKEARRCSEIKTKAPKQRGSHCFPKKIKEKDMVILRRGYSKFVNILSSNSVLPNRILLYNDISFSFFLFLDLFRENLGANLFKVQVREVYDQAVVLHCPSSQKLKTFKVLDKLKVKKLL